MLYPCFKDKDKVTVKNRKPKDFVVGDIAVFRRRGDLYAHRVIRTGVVQKDPYIVTQPDAFFCKDDGLIFEPDILGVVVSVERNGKLISGLKSDGRWIRKPAVFTYLLWHHFLHRIEFLAKKLFF